MSDEQPVVDPIYAALADVFAGTATLPTRALLARVIDLLRQHPDVARRFLILDLGDLPQVHPELIPSIIVHHGQRLEADMMRTRSSRPAAPATAARQDPGPPAVEQPSDARFRFRRAHEGCLDRSPVLSRELEEFIAQAPNGTHVRGNSYELTLAADPGTVVAIGLILRCPGAPEPFRVAVDISPSCREAAGPMRECMVRELDADERSRIAMWESEATATAPTSEGAATAPGVQVTGRVDTVTHYSVGSAEDADRFGPSSPDPIAPGDVRAAAEAQVRELLGDPGARLLDFRRPEPSDPA